MIGRRSFLGFAAAVLAAACDKGKAPSSSSSSSAVSTEDDDALGALMAPATLAGRLEEVKAGKVLVLHVGPKVLWKKSRIPGSEWVGEGSSSSGYDAFAARLAKVPPEVEVVAYCGCCAVEDCPNVRPASRAIRESKRAKAYLLDLPTNFGTDWERKGLPVERG